MNTRHAQPVWSMGMLNWLSMVAALLRRDMATRFAGDAVGYAWAVITPMTWILAIALFFDWLGRTAPIDADLPVFLATGMLPYLLFRSHVTSLMRVERSARHLVTMGPARPEDIFTATSLLEGLNALFIPAAVLTATAFIGHVPLPHDPLLVLFALSLAWGLGASIGRLAAVLNRFSPAVGRILPILLRPFFWISGIFFIAAELPAEIAAALWWNPVLHVTELLRAGWFLGFESGLATATVPLLTILIAWTLSRGVEAVSEDRVPL